ncbi:hypothetical protein D9M71_508390 [compost metagenome]
MHAAGMAAAVGQAAGLVDRQGIHVGAQSQAAGAAADAQHADHPGTADAGMHLVAPFAQPLRHLGGGALFLETQFGVGVDILAQGLQLGAGVVEPSQDVLVSSHAIAPRSRARARSC